MSTLYNENVSEDVFFPGYIATLKDSSYYCLEYAPEATVLVDQDFHICAANIAGMKAIQIGSICSVNNQLVFQDKQSLDSFEKAHARIVNKLSNYERFISRVNGECVACILYPASDERSKYLFTIKSQNTDEFLACLPEVARIFALTETESRILTSMVQGMRPKEIAINNGNSLNTVRAHLRTIYAKMRVRSYNEALSKAISLIS